MEKRFLPWIIFDADNTLWDVETLYDNARREFAELVKDVLELSINVEQIEDRQDSIDKKLGTFFKYDGDRFARSFEDTILHYTKKEDILDLDEAQQMLVMAARRIAKSVFLNRACLFQDTIAAMQRARERGYKIGIFTAGEEWVQQRRLSQSGLEHLCDAVEIVSEKSEENLRDFCRRRQVDRVVSYFIGDSLRSDIKPAKAVSLKTIHVTNKNWERHESDNIEPDYTAENLKTAIEYTESCKRPRRCADAESPVRVIFEGGGAKGIAHVGALKVLEERGLHPEHVAGSSAGAIVAGLVAAGYKADDILRPHENGISDDSILKANLDERLGSDNWKRIGWFRRLVSPSPRDKRRALGALATAVLLFFAIWLAAPWWLGWYVSAVAVSVVVASAVAWRQSRLRDFGLASLDDFVAWYDELLRESPAFRDTEVLCRVTFRHFHEHGLTPPALITADLTRQKLSVLTYHETKGRKLTSRKRRELEAINDMPVAEAVAASAALPIVFQPRRPWSSHPERMLVDGGMLSNLPAWSVADDRETRETRNPIIALALTEQSPEESRPRRFLAYLKRMISTSISGVRALETRDIEGLHVIDIPTAAEVTAFDMTESEKIRTYREGYDAAKANLADAKSATAWKLVSQSEMKLALKMAHDECVAALWQHARQKLEQALPHGKVDGVNPVVYPHLRVNIMWVTSLDKLRIAYSYGMDADTDDDLALRRDGGGAGLALARGRSVLVDMQEARYRYSRFRMTKYEQALVRPSLRVLYSVPLSASTDAAFSDVPIEAVLNFDTDDALVSAFKEDQIANALDEAAVNVLQKWRSLAAGDDTWNGGKNVG